MSRHFPLAAAESELNGKGRDQSAIDHHADRIAEALAKAIGEV